MASGSTPLRTIREWYRLSHERSTFFAELRALDCELLIKTLQANIAFQPRGRLRTQAELAILGRAQPPSVATLRTSIPDEQTLQWMFMHRGFLEFRHEHVVWRELPTCCAGENADGWADLLVFDEANAQPVIVELKRGSADDPLTGVLLEALWHWTFNLQHHNEFHQQVLSFGHRATTRLKLAVAAPKEYYARAKQKTRSPRGDEYEIAMSWVACLRHEMDLDLYAINDDWQTTGPDFDIRKVVIDSTS